MESYRDSEVPTYLQDKYRNLEKLPKINTKMLNRNTITGNFIKADYYVDNENSENSTYDSHMSHMKKYMLKLTNIKHNIENEINSPSNKSPKATQRTNISRNSQSTGKILNKGYS